MNALNLKNKIVNLSPPSMLALGFLSFIVMGTILLMLPVSHHGDLSLMTAFFTATSAVTITGLSVVSINETYTVFGQLMILLMIQAGGLGFITFAILAALSLSPKIGLKQQIFAQNALGQTSLHNVTFVAKGVLIYTLFFELIGFIFLLVAWYPQFGLTHSAYYALFYSVSAFNNAGFTLFDNSLMEFQNNFLLCMTVSTLYILGGIGFVVFMDIKQAKVWRKLNINSKVILSSVLIINLVAFVLLWALEANNPNTIGNMNTAQQATHAWFQATVPRSSGFNSVDTASMTNASTFLMMLLMFIGGGSLSTAGGIKVGTFVILLLSVISFLRRNDETSIFKRSISHELTFKALAVTLITCFFIIFGMFLLLIFEPEMEFIDVVFEVLSAACTVGLSRGITAELHDGSLLTLIFLMYAGRLGPLTLVYLIATPKKSRVQYPSADIQIG